MHRYVGVHSDTQKAMPEGQIPPPTIQKDVELVMRSGVVCSAPFQARFLVWQADEHFRVNNWNALAKAFRKEELADRLSGHSQGSDHVAAMGLENVLTRLIQGIKAEDAQRGDGTVSFLRDCAAMLRQSKDEILSYEQVERQIDLILKLTNARDVPVESLKAALEMFPEKGSTRSASEGYGEIWFALMRTKGGEALVRAARTCLQGRQAQVLATTDEATCSDAVDQACAVLSDPQRPFEDAELAEICKKAKCAMTVAMKKQLRPGAASVGMAEYTERLQALRASSESCARMSLVRCSSARLKHICGHTVRLCAPVCYNSMMHRCACITL